MQKTRKTSHITNIIQFDADGHVVIPASLTLGVAPGSDDNSAKVPSTAWVRSIVTTAGGAYVPTGRTITINGVSYDLSSNRSWSINTGVLTATAGAGISVSTVSGNLNIVNTGLLTATSGAGISVSTVNQNLNIVNTGLLTATSGAGITVTTVNQNLNIVNTGILTSTAGAGISVTVVDQNLNVVNTGILTSTAGAGISVTVVDQNLNVVNTGLLTATAGSGISISTVNQNLNIVNTGLRTATAGAGISISVVDGNLNIVNTITNNNQLTNGANYATQSYVTTQINNLVSGAPGLLDTLDELAAALGDDPNFATTVTTALSNRLRIDIGTQGLTSTQQGYGRTNLGLGSLAVLSSIGDAQITDVAWSKVTGAPAFITGNQTITLSGDATGSGATTITVTLANSGVTAGTYGSSTAVPVITVDAKGRVTSVTTASISGSLTFTGDVTGSGTTGSSTALTLANSGVTAGTYQAVTVDAKGRVTAGSNPTTLSGYGITDAVPSSRTITINGTALDLSLNRSWAVGDVRTDSTYANPAWITSLAWSKITGAPAFLTSYTETDPFRVTTVAVSGTSTKTITLTRADGSLVTTTWTDIDTDTNTFVTSASFSGGTLTLTRNDAGTVSVSLDGRYYLASNPSGYISGITSSMVTTALGYTPYNSSNPAGYITSSSLSSYLPLSGGTMSGAIIMSGTQQIRQAGFSGIEYYNGTAQWQGYIGTENNTGNLRYNSFNGTHTWYSNGSQTMQLGSSGILSIVNDLGIGTSSSTSQAIRLGGDNAAGGRLYFQYAGDSSYIDSYGGHGGAQRYRDLQIVARNLNLTSSGGTVNANGSQVVTNNSGTWSINITGNSATTSQRSFSGDISTSGMGRFEGWYNGTAATGLATEVGVSSGLGYIIVYNRQTGTYGTLNLNAVNINIDPQGGTASVSGSRIVTNNGGTWSISVTGSAGSVSGLTLNSISSAINPNNVTQNQIGYNTSVNLFGQTDGGLYSSAYSPDWIHQIYGDFRSGQIAIRGKQSGTWQAWRVVLDSSNYTSYTPSLTGSGANGTWAISITGNAQSSTTTTHLSSRTDGAWYNVIWGAGSPSYLYSSDSVRILSSEGALRANVYYDNQDTAYYLNPAGGSRLRNLYVGDSGDDWSDPGGWGTQVRFSNGPHVRFVLHARSPGIEAGMYVHTPGSVFIGSYTGHDVSMMWAGSRRMQISNSYIYTDVYLEAAGSLRAPIFYDSNDTGYYGDFASTSRMNNLILGSAYTPTYQGQLVLGHTSYNFNFLNGSWASSITAGILANCADEFEFAIHDSGNSVESLFIYSGGRILMGRSIGWGTTYIEAAESFRAPIFYDSNDAGYWLDPNGSTSLYVAGKLETTRSSGTMFSHGSMTDAIGYNGSYGTYIGSVVGGTYYIYGNGTFFDNGTIRTLIHSGNIGNQSVNYANQAGTASNANTVGGFGAGSFFRDLGFEGGGSNANTISETRSAFTYAVNAPWSGPLAYFGASGYGLQLNALYHGGGGNISYRTRNGDNGTWNSWREFIHSGNIGSQSVSYANSAGSVSWGNVSSKPADWLNATNLISWNAPNDAVPSGFYQHIDSGGGNPVGTWFNYVNVRHSNPGNVHGFQIGMSYYDNELRFRSYQGSGTYQAWVVALSSQNFTSYVNAPNAVGNGNGYYNVQNWLQVNGSHGIFWPGHYSFHIRPNISSTHTQMEIIGSKNSYGGIYDNHSAVNGMMYDGGGNGGVYREANGRWYWYYHLGNNSMGIGSSANSSSYVLYASGNIYATGDIVAYSDRRKKTNIVTIENALDTVGKMRGVFYDKIGEEEKGRQLGVIAQEVNEVLPEAVTYAQDVDEYGVKYGNMVGLLLEAIKEQQSQIEDLKNQITELKENK